MLILRLENAGPLERTTAKGYIGVFPNPSVQTWTEQPGTIHVLLSAASICGASRPARGSYSLLVYNQCHATDLTPPFISRPAANSPDRLLKRPPRGFDPPLGPTETAPGSILRFFDAPRQLGRRFLPPEAFPSKRGVRVKATALAYLYLPCTDEPTERSGTS